MENTAHILGRVQDGAGLKCVGTFGNPIYIKLLAPTLVSKQIFSQRKTGIRIFGSSQFDYSVIN